MSNPFPGFPGLDCAQSAAESLVRMDSKDEICGAAVVDVQTRDILFTLSSQNGLPLFTNSTLQSFVARPFF